MRLCCRQAVSGGKPSVSLRNVLIDWSNPCTRVRWLRGATGCSTPKTQVADCLYGRVFAPEAERARQIRTRRVRCGALWARSSPSPTGRVDDGQILGHLCALNAGQRVVHRIFGEGIVLQIKGRGEFTRVHVNFDAVGEKRLMLNVAKLVALD